MNVSEFVAQCRSEWPGFEDARRLALHEHPKDRCLESLPTQIQGMATENKLMLLNLAARNLGPGEVYVEVGCWHGLSLAGAALNNPDAPIYACDDFSQFNGRPEQLDQTIKKNTIAGQVRFFEMDFVTFFDIAPWRPARIGVYFYDGGHTFEQQYYALERVLPWLAPQAIVIVDDTNAGQVRSANKLFISRTPGFQLLSDVRTPGNGFPTWWNGMQIYEYQSNDKERTSRDPGLVYQALRLFWDEIVPPTREVMQKGRRVVATIPGLKPLYQHFRA